MEAVCSYIAQLNTPVLVVDSALCATSANPAACEALQKREEEIIGQPIDRVIGLERGQTWFQPLLESVLKGTGIIDNIELQCALSPDSHKVFALSGRKIKKDSAESASALVELIDITEHMANEHDVQAVNAALRQRSLDCEGISDHIEAFSHSVSHDLRTPLKITNHIAHLLLKDYGSMLPRDATNRIKMIIDGTSEMGELVDTLLEFSQASHAPLKKKSVDLEALAQTVVDDISMNPQGREVSYVLAALPSCHADRALIKQVLVNLVSNALKYTRADAPAEIHIGFLQDESGTTYFVRDNGVGFKMSDAESIFRPFERLPKTEESDGSGIGLSLVRRIVERHGGRIWTESSVGEGATFFFTLADETDESSLDAEATREIAV